jgi:truncated hemoglobin YjbI
MTSTPADGTQPPPTLFAWAGGAQAFSRLTRIFYGHVKTDPILAPVFAQMSPQHPQWVAQWLGEVFGGPATYTQERGGYPHMLSRHLGRALTEPQRARWVRLMGEAADEAGLSGVGVADRAGQQPARGTAATAHAGAPLGLGPGRPTRLRPGCGPTTTRDAGTRLGAIGRGGGWRTELRAGYRAAVHRP